MPRLLRFSAAINWRRLTLRRSTRTGTGMPCGRPRIFSHVHRLL